MAKRPNWVMKSWTTLNINEFVLFDMFGSSDLTRSREEGIEQEAEEERMPASMNIL